jgi:hypothetical protein
MANPAISMSTMKLQAFNPNFMSFLTPLLSVSPWAEKAAKAKQAEEIMPA